jgi:hypothetical protein
LTVTAETHHRLRAFKRQLRWEQKQGDLEAEARRVLERYPGPAWELTSISPRFVARSVSVTDKGSETRRYASGSTLKQFERELHYLELKADEKQLRRERRQERARRAPNPDNDDPTTEETTTPVNANQKALQEAGGGDPLAALDAQIARDNWLADTHIHKRSTGPRDLWAEGEKPAEPAKPKREGEHPSLVKSRELMAAYQTDPDDLETYFEMEELAHLDVADRQLAAVALEAAERMALEGNLEGALRIAVEAPVDPVVMGMALRDVYGEEAFDSEIISLAQQAEQELIQDALEKVRDGVAANPVLQTPEGVAILQDVFAHANLEAPPTPEQADALTRAAARAATERERQAKEARYHKAFDDAIAHSPYATGEGEPTREFWPTPGGETDGFDREVSNAQRVAEAISSDDPQSAQEEIDRQWDGSVGQREALDAEWNATMESVRERAAQEAAEEAANS